MTVLPVTTTLSADEPSCTRLSAASVVGAKCMLARSPMIRRLASSGNGLLMSYVRRPASMCPTGMPWWKAAKVAAMAVVVSPWTSTVSGSTSSST